MDGFNYNAAVGFAEPFNVQTIRQALGCFFAALGHRVGFSDGDIVDANFTGGGKVADAAGLERGESMELRVRSGGFSISKFEQATGEVAASVAFQFEEQRFVSFGEPNFAGNRSFAAV